VTVSANASAGYLASSPSAAGGPQADTSALNKPNISSVTKASNTSLKINFTVPIRTTAPNPTSYTAMVCTDLAMSQNCVTKGNFATGGTITGLTHGNSYFAEIFAVAPAGYIGSSFETLTATSV
jgi:hypothetical protein